MAPALFSPMGRVPLKPFAGTIGLAPAEPGLHSVVPPRRVGGNLDIRDLSAGTVLYLPVEVEGALFSVGDTHAAQGDGEVCGTAIESPMNVVLDVRPGEGRQPRDAALHHARPGDPPSRRQGLRGDDRHRPRPDGRRRATRSASMIDLLGRPARPVAGRRLHALLGLRRPPHQRDRRHAELGRLVLFPAGRLRVTSSAPAGRTPTLASPSSPSATSSSRSRRRTGARTRGRRLSFDLAAGETLCIAGEIRLGQVDDGARRSCGCCREPMARIAGGIDHASPAATSPRSPNATMRRGARRRHRA